jgi:hypothetical protein
LHLCDRRCNIAHGKPARITTNLTPKPIVAYLQQYFGAYAAHHSFFAIEIISKPSKSPAVGGSRTGKNKNSVALGSFPAVDDQKA